MFEHKNNINENSSLIYRIRIFNNIRLFTMPIHIIFLCKY